MTSTQDRWLGWVVKWRNRRLAECMRELGVEW